MSVRNSLSANLSYRDNYIMINSTTIINDELLTFADSVHYIETLYLQTNLHSHIEGELPNDKKHKIALDKLFDDVLFNAEYVGTSKGREWYRADNYRIGVITDYDKAIKSNWYTCLIQYEQHHMWACMADIDLLELPLANDKSLYKIQRADATLIYKSDIDYLNGYGVISKYRKQHTIDKSGVIETKYLGTRSSGNMVRWYNKTNELKQTENYKKIELLSRYFGDIENLFTIELEMNREYLFRTMNIDTLKDLSRVKDAYKNIVGSMRVYELNTENELNLKNNNSSRIEGFRFAEWVEYKRIAKKSYKPSKSYLVDRMKKSSLRYIESMKVKNEDINKELLSIVNELIGALDLTNGKEDMIISYEPTMLSEELKEMREKHERVRGVNDLLIVESNKAMQFYPFKPKK